MFERQPVWILARRDNFVSNAITHNAILQNDHLLCAGLDAPAFFTNNAWKRTFWCFHREERQWFDGSLRHSQTLCQSPEAILTKADLHSSLLVVASSLSSPNEQRWEEHHARSFLNAGAFGLPFKFFQEWTLSVVEVQQFQSFSRAINSDHKMLHTVQNLLCFCSKR